MNYIAPVVTEVLGLQHGDEGTLSVTNLISKDARIIMRSKREDNATSIFRANGKEYELYYLSPNIAQKDTIFIIGPGAIIDPKLLIADIEHLSSLGIKILQKNLIISERAHVILPYHKELDQYYDRIRLNHCPIVDGSVSANALTTLNFGIRMYDILYGNWEVIEGELKALPQTFMDEYFGEYCSSNERKISIQVLYEQMKEICQDYRIKLHKYIRNVQGTINRVILAKGKITIEGGASYGLDLTQGEYPFCSSSLANSCSILASTGIGPLMVKDIIGVAKPYQTKNTEGIFITEAEEHEADIIRNLGNEYNRLSKLPRRCGWLDLLQLKNAAFANSVTKIALTHIDSIGRIGKNLGHIKVAVGYKMIERQINYIPTTSEKITPIYHYFDGWVIPENCKSFEQLPQEAKKFIAFVEKTVGIPVSIIGIGPGEEDFIVRK